MATGSLAPVPVPPPLRRAQTFWRLPTFSAHRGLSGRPPSVVSAAEDVGVNSVDAVTDVCHRQVHVCPWLPTWSQGSTCRGTDTASQTRHSVAGRRGCCRSFGDGVNRVDAYMLWPPGPLTADVHMRWPPPRPKPRSPDDEDFGGCTGTRNGRGRYIRRGGGTNRLVEGEGFEPPKHCAADLQSAPFGRLGTPPQAHVRAPTRSPSCASQYSEPAILKEALLVC